MFLCERLLGSPIGSESFVDGYIKDTIDTWLHDLDVLCTFAESQPQAAYAAFTHGLFSRWAYFFRSCSVPSEHLSALDEMIRCKLIPALSGKYAINDLEWTWLVLPIRHGGMGLIIPSAFAESQYTASPELTQPLVGCLLDSQKYLPYEVFENQCRLLDSYLRKKRSGSMTELQAVRDQLDVDKVRLLDVAGEHGASVWLSALPLSHHGFDLHKSSFRDAVCIRYRWQPQDLPSSCVCGLAFSIDHALYVQWVVSLPYGIMSCGILLHHFRRTSAVTLHESLPYSLSRESHSLCPPLWMVMELVLMLQRMVSGAFLIREHFLMCRL